MSSTSSGDLSELLRMALQMHQAGQLDQARGLYERILVQQPAHADALNLLGILTHQGGDPVQAAELIRRSIAAKPHVASYHNNLAKILEESGDLQAALASYNEALRLGPNDPIGHSNLGLLMGRLGRLQEAESSLRAALRLRPQDAECHYNLGNILRDLERPDDAIAAYKEALRLRPESADAHNNMGNVLHRLGRLQEAVDAHRKVIDLRPSDAASQVNLGNALADLGQMQEALNHYDTAIRLNSQFAEAYQNGGRVLMATGDLDRAIDAFRNVLEIKPDSVDARCALASAFRMLTPSGYEPPLEDNIRMCLATPEVNAQDLARIGAHQLKHKHRLRERLRDDDHDLLVELMADELLSTLLPRIVNVDPDLEQALTAMRRQLMLQEVSTETPSDTPIGVLTALALQCFNNEYVFSVAADEEDAVSQLVSRCERLLELPSPPLDRIEKCLACLAMYRPLYGLAYARTLDAIGLDKWSEVTRPLIQRTLSEPFEELHIEEQIESLGNINDPISQAVRAQYEEHPYPRWVDLPATEQRGWRSLLQRVLPRFSAPAFVDGSTRMLVAGCGTGMEPVSIALACSNTEVVAIDLSRRSLAYAARMARKLGVDGIRFLQTDILSLPSLKEHFHIVECAGVLHHMADPLRGWRVLSDLLLPGGLMKIGLYSERAREPVVAARAYIGREGLRPVASDIKAVRTRILSKQTEPALMELAESEDLYAMSTCRDLLFHAQEHRFTLPQIREALADLKLKLIGFELPAAHVKQRYTELFSDDLNMTNLENWERFEQIHPRVFSGMYLFWCQKEA
ncbi:MAG: tetratricopeptide repeat protein [Acidiferrobacterales bacterium]